MTIPPISLDEQIAEVEREIRQRARLYPAWVEKGRLKAETADAKLAALRAAQSTLMWLDRNHVWIKQEAQRRVLQAQQETGVQAVLAEFPGAVATSIPPTSGDTQR